jgi:PAS domain S-box-containing protein
VSKARRPSPNRGTRESTAVAKGPRLDLLQAAADIVAALPDAVVITGMDRRVLAANEAGAQLLGWQMDNVVGQLIAEHVIAAERTHVAAREDKVLAGEPQRYETRIVNHATGEERDVSVSSGPFRVNGALIGTVATLRDITDPKRAQDTLARSEAR